MTTKSEFKRKPDGGLAEQIEVLEAMSEGDAFNTELLMLLIELRSLRQVIAQRNGECDRLINEIAALKEEKRHSEWWNNPVSKKSIVTPDLWELNNPGEGSYYMSHEPTGWRKEMVIARYVKIEEGCIVKGIE